MLRWASGWASGSLWSGSGSRGHDGRAPDRSSGVVLRVQPRAARAWRSPAPVVDRFVDLGDIREQLRPFYSDTGRPSVDPELMIRMLIVGYCMGIRSERRLCEEVHLNLAYRWFCRLGLDGAVPDHSTFSEPARSLSRERTAAQAVRNDGHPLHRERARRRPRLAVDASMIKADANRQNSTPGDRWEPPDDPGHAVREYLAVLDEAAFGGATQVVPSSSRPPIRPRAGRARMAGSPSSLTRTTI